MHLINRNSFVVKPKQPYVDWINGHPLQDYIVTLEEIREDCNTFLIPNMIGKDDALEYIQAFKLFIFELELENWYRTPELWPQNRTPEMFDEWFDLEFNSAIFDLVRKRIRKERW